jgi:hypothetical protein
MTNDILPAIIAGMPTADPAGRMPKLHEFLQGQFHRTLNSASKFYPGLPMLMSLPDTALGRRQAFHTAWDANSILEIREAVEVGIFDVLEDQLSGFDVVAYRT